MEIGEIIYQILIGPLELFFEVLYTIAQRFIGNYGLAIIVLSLIMNFLVLPIYQRADRMQEEERDIEAKLHDGITHIRKTFKGDERMMMLQTYYRQNDYKPTDVIKGSISLFLEIPFFIAAYHFLSHLEALRGISFGPIPDLGAPDAMIPFFGGMHLNLLPIIMTVTNIISAAIYTKGFPKKTKIQLYGMAAFFLVFLYTSPAGLVFYWTLNNIFSLIKNVFYKLKHPKRVLAILAAIVGIIFLVLGGMQTQATLRRNAFLLAAGVALELPFIWWLLKRRLKQASTRRSFTGVPNKTVFTTGCLFLTVMTGLMIPSTLIKASPLEFINISYYLNPNWYIVSAFCLSAGLFLVWIRVFYWLASDKGKSVFDKLIWACGICALFNYLFFGKDFGVISANLVYENGMHFARKTQLLNLLLMIAIIIGVFLLLTKWQKHIRGLLFAAVLAVTGMSVYNINGISTTIKESKIALDDEMATWTLSKTGNNVIVLMMDRAMGELVPYLFNERPELKDQFAGFTYYSNVVSFGAWTNVGSPALYGGYEYTPLEMNKRDTELLEDKHNESLLVMPVNFDQNDYEVTVCDPTYAGYQWIPDLSIYDEYPDISAYITNGRYSDPVAMRKTIKETKRNFFCFSFMKSMPVFTQPILYNHGKYNAGGSQDTDKEASSQTQTSIHTAVDIEKDFVNAYNVLKSLPDITEITDENINTFLMMSNDTTHEPMMLQEPEYEPAAKIDNTEYDRAHTDRFTVNGVTLKMEDEDQVIHYHANMASFIQLGKWFDYLRENDVYDNTRIIIVADHGRHTAQLESFIIGDKNVEDLEIFFPLLMVKDFNSTELTESEEFMTNADVPTLAFQGLIEDPINPSTGNRITNEEKYLHDQYLFGSSEWNTEENNGTVFFPGVWFSVKDDMRDTTNWTELQEYSTSPFEDTEE